MKPTIYATALEPGRFGLLESCTIVHHRGSRGERHGKGKGMLDYDLVVVGSGYAGSTAALCFLEIKEQEGRVGSVALIEAGKKLPHPAAATS